MFSSTRIVNTYTLLRENRATGEMAQDYLLAVAPPGVDMQSEEDYLAEQRKMFVGGRIADGGDPAQAAIDAMREWPGAPRAAAVRRWRARLLWFVAADIHGDVLRRSVPFQWPADPRAERLYQIRLTPDGIPDLVPESNPRFPDARVNPDACLVTKSDDPKVVATWWWSLEYGGFPREAVVQMYRIDENGERVFLTRTEG